MAVVEITNPMQMSVLLHTDVMPATHVGGIQLVPNRKPGSPYHPWQCRTADHRSPLRHITRAGDQPDQYMYYTPKCR